MAVINHVPFSYFSIIHVHDRWKTAALAINLCLSGGSSLPKSNEITRVLSSQIWSHHFLPVRTPSSYHQLTNSFTASELLTAHKTRIIYAMQMKSPNSNSHPKQVGGFFSSGVPDSRIHQGPNGSGNYGLFCLAGISGLFGPFNLCGFVYRPFVCGHESALR